jgi:hypothetical protein
MPYLPQKLFCFFLYSHTVRILVVQQAQSIAKSGAEEIILINIGSGLTCFAASIKGFSAFVILFIFSSGLEIRKYPAFGNT